MWKERWEPSEPVAVLFVVSWKTALFRLMLAPNQLFTEEPVDDAVDVLAEVGS